MSKFEKIDETHFRKIPENRDIPLEVGDFVEVALNATEEEIANAKRAGCQFTFGTDSHSVKSLELVRVGDLVAEHLGLTKADIAEYLQDGVEE